MLEAARDRAATAGLLRELEASAVGDGRAGDSFRELGMTAQTKAKVKEPPRVAQKEVKMARVKGVVVVGVKDGGAGRWEGPPGPAA